MQVSLTSRSCRLCVACLGLVCLLQAGAVKTRKPRKESHHGDAKVIEALEQQWRNDLLQADTASLDKLLADDFVAISSNGTLSGKQQYLQRLGSHTNRFASIDLRVLKVRVQPDSAIATSEIHVVGTIEGRAVDGMFLNTRVYGRGPNGQWRVLNTEATRVSGPTNDAGDMERGTPLQVPSAVAPQHP